MFFSSCYHPSSSETMEDLKRIEGKWTSYKGIKFNENWRFENEDLFKGEGYSLNGADTSFFETLQIIKKNDSVYYSVFFKNENAVYFLLTEASKNKWKFTNPQNEYPSIIEYKLENDTLLTVVTSNIRGNKEQFFYLKRK
jgi:hypothetical protein